MRFGSLFAGIGGFDLGLERAGMTCAWQVENEAGCVAVLSRAWPATRRYGDIAAVSFRDLPRVDLLCGGPPCQPFSSASRGRRSGTADDRHLWPEMRRAVVELEPAWVVLENVTHFDGPALEQVVSDLETLRYEVAPPLEVPACAFGYDHGRPRLWVVGYADRNRQSGLAVDGEVAGLPRHHRFAGGLGDSHGLSAGVD